MGAPRRYVSFRRPRIENPASTTSHHVMKHEVKHEGHIVGGAPARRVKSVCSATGGEYYATGHTIHPTRPKRRGHSSTLGRMASRSCVRTSSLLISGTIVKLPARIRH